MSEQSIDTNHLVKKTLSLIPVMSKKLFGPSHILHGTDLNHTHFHILFIIEETETVRTTDVAKKLAIKNSNLTPLLNKLVEKGFIERNRRSEDRRVIYLSLTQEGSAFLAEKKRMMEREVKKKLAVLNEEDQWTLLKAVTELEGIMAKLESGEESGKD